MAAVIDKKPVDRVSDTTVDEVIEKVKGMSDVLEQYSYVASIRADNIDLFYAALMQHPVELLPVVYTPGVGTACQNWGKLEHKPKAFTLSIADKGSVEEKMRKFTDGQDIHAIVVTDGGRILGLGDLGANGIGIPVGKSFLYSAAGGVKPENLLPTVLDVGCSDEKLRGSDVYVGANKDRVSGDEYDEFIEEWHSACQSLFGREVLIHWEDFGGSNASRLLHKYENEGPSFNDDIQSTAAVALASILGACRAEASLNITEHKAFVFMGAGEANLGIAALITRELTDQGVDEAEARKRMWMVDSGGIIAYGREKSITEEKSQFAQSEEDAKAAGCKGGTSLADAVEILKPTCLIGAAGKGGAFTKEILTTMSNNMPQLPKREAGSNSCGGRSSGQQPGVRGMRESDKAAPIVLALSNPTDNSECTFEQAWDATDRRVVFAAGSPFPAIDTDDGELQTSQANNALIYPGLGTAAILSGAQKIPQSFFLAAAHALADATTAEEGQKGLVVPPVLRIRDAGLAVAARVCMSASADGLDTERANKEVMRSAKKALEAEGEEARASAEKDLRSIIAEWRF